MHKTGMTGYQTVLLTLLTWPALKPFPTGLYTMFDSNLQVVNFPFLDRDAPRSPSYGVYISQLIRLTSVCSKVHQVGA